MTRRLDLTNQRFGRLVAIAVVKAGSKSVHAKWHCVCDCGGSTEAFSASLRRGNTAMCQNCVSKKRSYLWHKISYTNHHDFEEYL